MSGDPLDAMIRDALERARRNEPIPCDACGAPTPAGQLRETAVPDRDVDFGDYSITLNRVRRPAPHAATPREAPAPAPLSTRRGATS